LTNPAFSAIIITINERRKKMIYTITYIFDDRMDYIKCQGKSRLIEQYRKLIQKGANVLIIKDMLGEKVYIKLT
jgi:hypothetical protein